MSKIFALIILVILLAACAPSQQVIQTAIAQTLAAAPTIIPIPIITFTLSPVFTATFVPLPSSPTPRNRTTYIIEEGFCVIQVGKITGNPTGQPGCAVTKRTQIQLGIGQEMEVALNNNTGDREIYCSLYSLDGTYLMSDLDTNGSGKVACHL